MKTRREYPKRPLVGVGVVLRRDEEVLLVKRAFPPKAGYYSIPGGLVELGEKVRDAARREISEETGLDIKTESVNANIQTSMLRESMVGSQLDIPSVAALGVYLAGSTEAEIG
jgi:8-oxo-dGTP pyrophosphatase MutT (NUDIX family)